MSGFGAMKKESIEALKQEIDAMVDEAEAAQEEVPEEQAPVEEKVEEKPAVKKQTPSNPLEAELQSIADLQQQSHVFCGVVGHENNGKTGVVMDAHMYNVQKDGNYGADDQLWAIDFDGGAAACRSAHYGNTPNIRVWSPWVMQENNRTAYDYPGTHQRLMDILMFGLSKAKEQNTEGYDGPRIRNLLITAVDLFDQVCINNMKIYDMETGAKDAIEASKHVINTKIGWNWSIRSTRYHQMTAVCRQLMNNGVNVFWETHLSPEVFNDKETGAWRPKWEKQSDNVLNQILWFRKDKIRNEDGKETGEVRYEVEFYKCKTNPKLQGQMRTVFVTKRGEDPVWYGLPELRDGML
tara:strand:+ start:2598 stop:3653 length:1056 start_codon:yes stop_codon:yes gene_type:complete